MHVNHPVQLVAMSCKLIEAANPVPQLAYWKAARVICQSTLTEASFTLTTRPLTPEMLEQVRRWEQHGFTVLELRSDCPWKGRNADDTWRNALILEAIEHVKTIHEKHGEQRQMAGYSKELARELLHLLEEVFPASLTSMQLKHQLAVEPSDEILLAALEALRKQALIEGVEKRENNTGAHRLIALHSICITPLGLEQLAGPPDAPSIIHNYVNHGHAGAMGPNSVGTINFQQQWSQLESQTNLPAVVEQFEQAIKLRTSTAVSSDEFTELHLMAKAKEEAEQHEGSKFMETITVLGKTALPILTSAGAHGLVSWLESSRGIKLS